MFFDIGSQKFPFLGGRKGAVLITPPPIPTGFQQNFQKGIFTYFFHFPQLDSYWTPTGFLLDSYWTPTELKQMSQTESNGSDTGFLLEYHYY